MDEEHVDSINDWMTEEQLASIHHFCKDLLEYRNDDGNFFALVSSINKQLNKFEDGCKYIEGNDCSMFKTFKKYRMGHRR